METLNLPFRWYDDVLKQNRYKDYCAQNCNFQLITQCDRLLPFQIKTDGLNGNFLNQWLIYDADGNEVLDLSSAINTFIEIITVDDTDYIIYKGDTSMTDYGFSLECATYYYAMLNDGKNYFYSELFYTKSFSETEFIQDLFQPYLPWRFYDNKEKENRFKGQCEQNCGFYLLTSIERLLPFQFRRLHSVFGIDSFILQGVSDPSCGITLEPTSIQIVTIGIYDYFIYEPTDLDNLLCGVFEAVIVSGGITYYSEPINIKEGLVDAGGFLLQETGYYILQENSDKIKTEQ